LLVLNLLYSKRRSLDTEFDWTEVGSALKSLSVPISTTLDRQKDQSVSLVLNVGYTFFGQDDDFEGDDYKIQTVYTKKLVIPKNKIVQPPVDNKPEEPVKPKEESKPELIPNDPKPKPEEPTDSSSSSQAHRRCRLHNRCPGNSSVPVKKEDIARQERRKYSMGK
jgi:outer membrane biosynthesis protein TonB